MVPRIVSRFSKFSYAPLITEIERPDEFVPHPL